MGRPTQHWHGRRHTAIGTTETVGRRYFIDYILAQAQSFDHAVRGHWGMEDSLQWRFDANFSDDASRIRKANTPAIVTAICHQCLNLFEQESSRLRRSQKGHKDAWNDYFHANVVFGQ